jgi:hypothetical protein
MGEPPTTAGTNRPCAILYIANTHYYLCEGRKSRWAALVGYYNNVIPANRIGVWRWCVECSREEVIKSASVPHRQKRLRNRFLPKFSMSTPPVPSS